MAKIARRSRLVPFIVVLILGILFGFIISSTNKGPKEDKSAAKKIFTERPGNGANFFDAVSAVAASVGPAVVSISTERTLKVRMSPFPYRREGVPFHDEFFERFFRKFFGVAPEGQERKQTGLGSGVVIDKSGYILTNEHVVGGADKIMVTLSNGRSFEAKIKGSDFRSDLAILKIDADDLTFAVLGDSDLVRTGEWVVAIGNPFGYVVDSPEPTVTAGVVSALHRSLPSKKSGYLDLIQTDAAINPGNSGGPLCDLEGNIIGINVAIFSTSGGYQGVGFAIPSNLIKNIIEDLKMGKKITYGWMGIVIQDVSVDLAKYFGMPDTEGVLISEIVKGSPAEIAGLKAGDVIVELEGNKIKNTKGLIMNISRIPVGKTINVKIVRDKKIRSITVDIGQMPSEEELARIHGNDVEPKEAIEVKKWRGIEVFPITKEVIRRFNIRDKEGVFIVNVDRGSQAYYASLRQGDIIKRIDTNIIRTIDDYKKAIYRLKGDVLVYTNRGFTIVKE